MPNHERDRPALIVVCGVSGSGKTTIGKILAARLNRLFIDADDYHSPGNIAKMAAAIPLTDEDRAPWLKDVNRASHASPAVLACSALKRAHRDLLRNPNSVNFHVQLLAPEWTIAHRLSQRQDHFMSASLLDSQFAAYEPLENDEAGLKVTAEDDPESLANCIVSNLSALYRGVR